jgi:hypothetical protein
MAATSVPSSATWMTLTIGQSAKTRARVS